MTLNTWHPPPVLGGFERTLTVTGPSKTHAMTGWRIGVFAAPTRCRSRWPIAGQHLFTHPFVPHARMVNWLLRIEFG